MKGRTRNRATFPRRRAGGGAEPDDRGWLPSGMSLVEFAMRSGLVAPRLLLSATASSQPPEGLLRRSKKD